MKPTRQTQPQLVPGKSVTRLHLCANPRLDAANADIHVAHYPDGDLAEPAQWYEIYERPDAHVIELLRKILKIDREDWKIVEHILGSFRWAMFEHPVPHKRSSIRVDIAAMQAGEWSTTYF